MSEQNPFAAPQAGLTPPERWADESPDALRKLRAGLTLVYFGICAGIALVTLTFLLSVFTVWDEPFPAEIAWLLAGAGVVALPVVASLGIGQVHCLNVPRESQGREYLLMSMVFQLLTLVYWSGHVAVSAAWLIPPTVISLLVAGVLPLAALASFVLFQWRVATYLRRHDLVRHAGGIAGWGLLTLLVFAIGLYLHLNDNHGVGVVVAYLAAVLLLIVTLVSTANLVTYLRTAITSLPSAVRTEQPAGTNIDRQDI